MSEQTPEEIIANMLPDKNDRDTGAWKIEFAEAIIQALDEAGYAVQEHSWEVKAFREHFRKHPLIVGK